MIHNRADEFLFDPDEEYAFPHDAVRDLQLHERAQVHAFEGLRLISSFLGDSHLRDGQLRLLLLLRSRLRLGRVLGGVRHLVEDVIVVAPVDTDKDALEVSEFLVFSFTQLALLREDVRLVPPLELLNVSHLHYLRKQLQLELGRDVVWLGDSLGLLLARFGLDRLLN